MMNQDLSKLILQHVGSWNSLPPHTIDYKSLSLIDTPLEAKKVFSNDWKINEALGSTFFQNFQANFAGKSSVGVF